MNLFNPLIRRLQILATIEENGGVLTPELEEQLTVSDDRIAEGTLALLELRETAEGNIMVGQVEADRIKTFIASNKRAVELIDAQLLEAANRLGTIHAGTFKVSTRPSSAAVIDDDQAVPRTYCRHVPAVDEAWVPDKTKLAAALRKGEEIPGVHLENRINLQIK